MSHSTLVNTGSFALQGHHGCFKEVSDGPWSLRALRFAFSLLCIALTTHVAAQPVPTRDPASTHVFPAGGRRGTVVPVRIGGECMPPEMNLHIWGDGVTAPGVLGAKTRGHYEASPRRDLGREIGTGRSPRFDVESNWRKRCPTTSPAAGCSR